MARAMQAYVDDFERAPVLVLPCLVRYREPTPTEGASVYPACQNLLLAAPRTRLRRRAHAVARPRRGRAPRALLGIPAHVFMAATITIGKPAGQHGPVRRRPIGELVYGERWGEPPAWAVDPPGTEHTSAGPRS